MRSCAPLPLCGSCGCNYYYSAITNTCEGCTQSWGNTGIDAGVVLLAAALAALVRTGRVQVPTDITSSWVVGIVRKADSGSIKVIFSTYQILQSITMTLNVEFPPLFTALLSYLSFFSFDVATLACSEWGNDPSHQKFAAVDSVFIRVYLLVPAFWLFLLDCANPRLLPPAAEDPEQIVLVR